MSEVTTVYEDEDFLVKVEIKEDIPFVHCYVDSFNKTVLKRMKEVFEGVKEGVWLNGWDEMFSYTPNPKFAKMMKGAETIDSFSADGEDYEVIRWVLDQQ